jgi:hypothetical protein
MLLAGEFASILAALGQPVTWTQAKAPHATATIRAVVQSTAKSQEAIVNAYGINGRSFQVAAGATVSPPEKFDVFTDAQGNRFVIDTVVEHQARGAGASTSFTCYCRGK